MAGMSIASVKRNFSGTTALPGGEEATADAGEEAPMAKAWSLATVVLMPMAERQLVLADGLPVPADPRVAQARRDEQGRGQGGQEQVVVLGVRGEGKAANAGRVDAARTVGDVDWAVEGDEEQTVISPKPSVTIARYSPRWRRVDAPIRIRKQAEDRLGHGVEEGQADVALDSPATLSSG